jgi:hypothetical protein
MQFELTALKQLQFKKPISFKVPLDEIDDKGETVYGTGHFIARFKQQDDDVNKELQSKIMDLRDALDKAKHLAENGDDDEKRAARTLENDTIEAIKAINVDQLANVWLGFEKHPLHVMPFVVSGEPLASNVENIKSLIAASIVQDAVSSAFIAEINPGVKKLLAGNSKR